MIELAYVKAVLETIDRFREYRRGSDSIVHGEEPREESAFSEPSTSSTWTGQTSRGTKQQVRRVKGWLTAATAAGRRGGMGLGGMSAWGYDHMLTRQTPPMSPPS